MSEETKTLVKSLKINKIFNQNITNVWNFISDVKKTYESLKDFRSQAIFTKGKDSTEVGAEFHFIWKKFLTLYFRIEEIVDNQNHKKMRMRILKSEPINISYEYIYHLYPISADNTTLLFWEWVYDDEGFPMSENEIEMLKNERNRMLDTYENYLINNSPTLYQSESISINSSSNKVFKLVSNPSILHKVIPSFADKYECEGDCSAVDSVFKLVKDEVCIELRVIRSDFKEGIYNYHLICNNISPKQELLFEIHSITQNQCFVNYRHNIHGFISQDKIKNISDQKLVVLKSIKGFLEYLSKEL